MASGLGIQLKGVGWERFEQQLAQGIVGAKAMARARFLIGSRLPYAYRWIELGERDDPRRGHMRIRYRTPRATHFMEASATAFKANFGRRRPSETTMGAILGVQTMQLWADDIADSMRIILNAEVYSTPIPLGPRGRPRWQRTHALYNSIRVYRA